MSLLSLLLLLPLAARANGSMVVSAQGTGSVRSSDFRAAYVAGLEPGVTTAVLQSAYRGDAADFAWIVPIPAPVVDGRLGVVPAAALDDLVRITEPRTLVWGASDCGSKGDAMSDSGASQEAGVEVLGEYQAGPYEVLELSADASADLTAWLVERGYAVDAATEPLLDLHAEEGWSFLVVTLRDASATTSSRGLPCLAFSYGSEEVVYPLRISASTTSEEVETLVMVWGDDIYAPRDDPAIWPELGQEFVGDDFAGWYDARARLTLEAAEGRAWLREWATTPQDEVGGGGLRDALVEAGVVPEEPDFSYALVSRYRAWLSPADMDRDLVLVVAEDQSLEGRTFQRSQESCTQLPRVYLGLLLLGGLLRRRRHAARRTEGARRA